MTVIPDKCIACMACINNCPVNAIKLVKGKAFINKQICIECGYCKQICPVNAIENR